MITNVLDVESCFAEETKGEKKGKKNSLDQYLKFEL